MANTRIFIKPLNNLRVYNPFTHKQVAPAGEETLEHTYWTRLSKQGDIEISECQVAKEAKQKSDEVKK